MKIQQFDQFLNEASEPKCLEQYETAKKELMALYKMQEKKAKTISERPDARADSRRINDGLHRLFEVLDANFDPYDRGHGDGIKIISKICDRYL